MIVISTIASMAPRPTGNRPTSASRIAGTFLRAAMGPIEYAASCLLGNKIQTGIEELAPLGLVESYQRGLGEVARLVGVPRADVERAMPMHEVAMLEGRLRESHARAIAAWKLHAGQFGFFDVVTALTLDGRRPDIGTCLERVAGKVKHDRELAEPLEALSVDVTAWSDLVARSRHVLEDVDWLAAALRRRVIFRVALAVSVVVVLFGLTAAIVGVRLARDAAANRVATVADCDAKNLSEKDLKWATEAQRAAVRDKMARCEAERVRVEAAERAAREEEERAEKAREAAAARKLACDTLASDVERGSLSDGSRKIAGPLADLIDRIARKQLEAGDDVPAAAGVPCPDTPAVMQQIDASFSRAVMTDPGPWLQKDALSPSVRKTLVDHKGELSRALVIALSTTAERTAKTYLDRGDKAILARAKHLCGLARDLGMPGHQSCTAVEKM